MASNVELLATELADRLELGQAPTAPLTRRELVLAAAALIRRHGPASTLSILRTALAGTSGDHRTILVFVVWSTDRLLASGASITRVCWHPLSFDGAELAWWDPATLASDEARRRFVEPTLRAAR